MANNVVAAKIKAGARVVDVRGEDEFADESFPGAINIPVGALQSRLKELEPKNAALVLYCASGARSALAAKILKASGWTDVLNAGGLSDMPEI
jgi:phage shock protein E